MAASTDDEHWMQTAINLASKGQGAVEPNPMVGCVIVKDGVLLGEGFHQKFGDKHAEVVALNNCPPDVAGATAYVSLEPCCHQGKTPPCVDSLIKRGVSRVVVAMTDPFPKVKGGGIQMLRDAGIQVDVGLLEQQATQLNAPYLKRLKQGRPWVIAKWAMTLDGKIATHSGDSKWISSEKSRAIVHRIRQRMDAIIVGSGTAVADDPLLTARPPGDRVPTRIVVDSKLLTPESSQLVRTAHRYPTCIAVSQSVDSENPKKKQSLENAGCRFLTLPGTSPNLDLMVLLDELGKQSMTNVLVEGGAGLLGGFFDMDQIDEVHVFIGNRIVGGRDALTAVSGAGTRLMSQAVELENRKCQSIDDDAYIFGRIRRP